MTDYLTHIFSESRRLQLSDLFFQEGQAPHGRMNNQILSLHDQLITLDDLDELWRLIGETPKPGNEIDTNFTLPEGDRFRANIHYQLGEPAVVLRPIKTEIPAMNQLGLPDTTLQSWAQHSHGLILITGSTGSGKSTTAAAMLQWINTNQNRHIITIEDPIEYLIKPQKSYITQREVGNDTESFESGLRAAMRQNPDVIFLGEIRDSLTATIAMQAAETGHLVVATMHSADVSDAVERLFMLLPTREKEAFSMILSNQLIAIITQRLLAGTSNSLVLVNEILVNLGAVSNWIRKQDINRLKEFMERDSNENVRFETSILHALENKMITTETARNAFSDVNAFDRIQAGIS